MTTILAFDTSGPYCDVAVLRNGDVLCHAHEAMTKGQAERLMPLIQEMMDTAGVAMTDLSAIGVGIGPGNFTGTRIAVSAARGLALGLGIPAEGVGCAEAYADGRDVTICLPAPRGQVHLGHQGHIETRDVDADLARDIEGPVAGPAADTVAAATGLQRVATPRLSVAIARIAQTRAAPDRPRPAPMYLRAADAAPAADAPPTIL